MFSNCELRRTLDSVPPEMNKRYHGRGDVTCIEIIVSGPATCRLYRLCDGEGDTGTIPMRLKRLEYDYIGALKLDTDIREE